MDRNKEYGMLEQQERTRTKRGRAAGGIRRAPTLPLLFSSLLFSSLLFSSLILCSVGLTACNGNGGAANSGGEVYTPNTGNVGTDGSTTSTVSTTGGSTGTNREPVTVETLHNLANGGNTKDIMALFPSGEDETKQTFYVSLFAEDFGVPENGSMTLSITGGDTPWTGLAYVVDGFLRFSDIPMVSKETPVTVLLTGYAPDGTIVSSGYATGTAVSIDEPLEIPILGPPTLCLGDNGTPNGDTAQKDGFLYEVIEYTGASLGMTATKPSSNAEMTVTVNGSPVGATHTLEDGFNHIVVTVTRGSGAPVSIERKVYVVKALVQPVIELGMNSTSYGRTVSSGGESYDVIEYTGTGLGMTVRNDYDGDNAATGNAVFEVTVNGTPVSGTSALVSTTLADGLNAIVATVTKEHCTTVREERYVYVVKALVQPVIELGTNSTSYGRTTSSGGKTYDVIEYTGTGLGMTVRNDYDGDNAATGNAVFEVTVNGTPVSGTPALVSMTALATGCNEIVATVTKEHCEPVQEERYVYVVKALSEDDIEIELKGDEGYGNDSAGYTYVKYSYISYDNLQMSVTNNYPGDDAATGNATMTVTVSGATSYSGDGDISDNVLNDGQNTITVTLTKPLCEGVEKKMKINAHIKKIKATATRGEIRIGNKDKLSGSVYFGGRLVRSFDKTGWKKNAYDAYNFREDYDPVYYLSEKSDTLRYYTSLDVSDPDKTFSLGDIKSAINSSGYLYASAFGSGNTSDHLMYMSLDNAE